MDDLTAAELITRKLTEGLSQQEREALDQHLAKSSTSRVFAQWSARIQDVIEFFRETDASAGEGPGLDPVTRLRLEKRLLEAMEAAGWDNPPANSDLPTGDLSSELTVGRKVAEDQPDYDANRSMGNDSNVKRQKNKSQDDAGETI